MQISSIQKTAVSQASLHESQKSFPIPNENTQSLDNLIKSKLGYDWKLIYRKLNADDVNNTGKVSMREFEKALHNTNTFLSKQDLQKIKYKYGQKVQ